MSPDNRPIWHQTDLERYCHSLIVSLVSLVIFVVSPHFAVSSRPSNRRQSDHPGSDPGQTPDHPQPLSHRSASSWRLAGNNITRPLEFDAQQFAIAAQMLDPDPTRVESPDRFLLFDAHNS